MMIVTMFKFKKLKTIYTRRLMNRDIKVEKQKGEISELKKELLKQKREILRLRKQRTECIDKVISLKDEKTKLQKELKKAKELYEDLKKETFGYNFFSKVASKKAIREAMGKDKK